MKDYFLNALTVLKIMVVFVSGLDSERDHHQDSSFRRGLDKTLNDGWTYLQLPIFQHSRVPLLDKSQFSPMRVSSREKLPEETKKLLVPPANSRAVHRDKKPRAINVICKLRKMIVSVNKQILGLGGKESELKLGTCDISKTTQHYHVFVYDVDQCAGNRKLVNNRVMYTNILHYSPATDLWPIRRSVPFSVPVECHFNRYHYSYKLGFVPRVEHQNYFIPLRSVDKVALTPRDELWRRMTPTDAYTVGHPMFFQVEGLPLSEGRLYVDSCYVTRNSSHLSRPRFSVIENHGCMTDSTSSRWSRFINTDKNNVIRFSLDAFLFHGMLGKHLYMHCETSVGPWEPTLSAKSCTYNQTTERWEEMFGSAAVCLCCDSKCLASGPSVVSKVISSEPWVMESNTKTTTSQSPMFIPGEVEAAEIQLMATLASTTTTPPRHEEEEEEEEEEEVLEPHRMFEDIFGLD